MVRLAYPIALVLFGLVVVAWFLFGMPDVEVTATVDPDVTVQCAGITSVDEETCVTWGDAVLRDGAPSSTFDLDDVVRLRLDEIRYSNRCTAQYFIGRNPDDAVWTEEITCSD